MRAVLIFCVIIAAAVACPLLTNKDCSCNLPKICPSTWNIQKFDSQCATLAFQGIWNLQMTTPTFMDRQSPLKTGLFCNSYPCTRNQIIFKDTTPCDNTDFNTEYEMIDSSYNLYTQCTETQRALLCPAYGENSPYAIFSVGSEKYYNTAITDKYPFIDQNLFRHKISQGICDRDYTIAVIGADKRWEEYMVLAVINQYDNFFAGDNNILWVVTRASNPGWRTYQKAYDDIKRSGLCPNYLVSVDHSLDSLPVPSLSVPSLSVPSLSVPSLSVPSLSVPSLTPITTGDINGVTEKTSVSTTSKTKSIVSDCGSSSVTSSSRSTITSTTTKSTVIIEKCSDFSSQYELGLCDLYSPFKGLQILKNLDNQSIRRALSGRYYMTQATPCSFYDSPNSRVGLLNTAFPACSMDLSFDDISMDKWDYDCQHMVMERGFNMMAGKMQMTRSYISSVYNENHPFGSSVFAFHSEGYYDKEIDEITRLTNDGMICKQPSDMYKNRIIASIIGYEVDEYLLFCIANQYKNPFFTKKQVPLIYCYTRQRIPSQTTLNRITQEILRCGLNPNYLIKIDQTKIIKSPYTFDRSYYESIVNTNSMTKSMVSTRGISLGNNSPICALPSICPNNWKVKSFKNQFETIAFQGIWNLQMTTPTIIKGNTPLKTGLFCNSFPCTRNQIIFKDTTPCDNTDFNTEYEMIDSSYNLYTQCTETQRALLCPAYGKNSPYAIFSVGSEKYYNTAITDKYPFIDQNLFRHKISQGICDRDYTIAVIGADECWEEYMVLAVINQYDNFFAGDNNILWVVTRASNPCSTIYQKAYDDIKRSGLCPNYLVSVDHSLDLLPVPSLSVPSLPVPSLSVPSLSVPLLSVPSLTPITTGDISSVTKQTSVSTTSKTKSIVSDCSSSSLSSTSRSTITSETTASTVIIEKCSDYSSLFKVAPCDLYSGIQILNNLDNQSIRRALSGRYYMTQATPCSFYDSPNSRVGLLNTAFPACSMDLSFDDVSMDKWDYDCQHMMVERGYNTMTGKMQITRSYISSAYNENHPFGSSVFALYSEGYYEKRIDEIGSVPLDGMICKPPSDIYNNQIISSIIGYREDDFLLMCIANKYNNPFFISEQVNQVYAYTRQRIPSLETMRCITQELLRCGYNPNHLIKIDQTMTIDDDYVFESSSFETESCWSSSTSSSTTISSSSSSSSSSISISCD